MLIKMAANLTRLKTRFVLSKKGQRGATAVEMALIAPTFFLLLMGVTETGLMMTAQQLLEHAAFQTSRLAKTGYLSTGKTQMDTVSQILTTELQSYGTFIDMTTVSMTSTSYNSFTDAANDAGGTSGLGTPQQIVVYTVTFPWKLFTPMMNAIIGTNGVVTLKTRIVVRNEPTT